MRPFAALSLAFAVLAPPALGDEVTDAIDSARAAYEEGDVAYATDELTYALQLMKEMKAQSLETFLPAPLDGWSREIDDSVAAGLGMMGGGIGAGAEYRKGGDGFSITIMADNPMVAAMAGMLGNAAMVTASGGRMIRVGREKFVRQDGQISGLIGNRVLIQADGDDADAIVAHLETMDLRALADFDN